MKRNPTGTRPGASPRNARNRILIIDDDPAFVARMTDYLRDRFEVSSSLSGREGFKLVGEALPDVVLLDYKLEGDYDGLDVLREIKARWSYINVILISAYLDEKVVAVAESLGVDECIPKNLKLEAFDRLILRAIERNLASRKSLLGERIREEHEIVPIFESAAMAEVRAAAERFRDLDENILVTGPPGSGKEVLARWIHFSSNRAAKPFCAVDLVSLAPGLIEEELFGRENGAAGGAAGAVGVTRGLLELAHGGTIVLDEIGDLPLAAQAKLLRAVEKKQFHRIGGDTAIAVDVRFVVLSSRDLPSLVRAGALKSELYYRINTLRIDMPPLARRREDIPVLARRMLETFAVKFRRDVREMDPAVERRFLEYRWPGNVRELECVMKSAIIRAAGRSIALDDVAPAIGAPLEAGAGETGGSELRLREAREAWERGHCKRLLSMTNGDVKEAARLAGIPRESFYRLLRRFKIDPGEFRR
jgi:DNA-binding NtrC family response regulator